MASYLPPTEELPIFDNSVFQSNDENITFSQATTEFLRFPTAQGTETFNDPVAQKSIIITPSQLSVNDNSNGPFGDPIFTHIIPNGIYLQNGNASNQQLAMNATIIQMDHADIGANISMGSGAVTATFWNVDITGNPYFNALKNTLTYTQLDGAPEFDLSNIQNLTFSMDMTQKINSLTFVNGVPNGNYKIYMTGINGDTFYKSSCMNNLNGDTFIGAGSFWILIVHFTGSLYVVDCQNYT